MITPVDEDDVALDARPALLRRRPRSEKLSRFWLLLPLAAVIASAGVVADSTATVIGAMIVAPLMTPILGTALGRGAGRSDQPAAQHPAGRRRCVRGRCGSRS